VQNSTIWELKTYLHARLVVSSQNIPKLTKMTLNDTEMYAEKKLSDAGVNIYSSPPYKSFYTTCKTLRLSVFSKELLTYSVVLTLFATKRYLHVHQQMYISDGTQYEYLGYRTKLVYFFEKNFLSIVAMFLHQLPIIKYLK